MNTKLFYIVNARIPTEKAHGYQICKMCEEYAKLGSEVELICPTRINPIKEDAHEYFGVENNFNITYVRSFDFLRYSGIIGRYSSYFQSILYFLKLSFRRIPDGSVVTRSPDIAWLFSFKKKRVFFEAHYWPDSKEGLFKYLLRGADTILCNSKGTEKKFRLNGFSNTLVVPNGVDLKTFENNKSKKGLRQELGLPLNKKIVMYVGHLYGWKGADTILDAASMISDNVIRFVFIGGTEKDIVSYRKKIQEKDLKNIDILGHKNKKLIPKYLLSADILLLPNQSVGESIEYTSPIKMFEYMAAGKPIIASNLRSIREVLDDDSAIFFPAGDSAGLRDKILFVFLNPEISEKIAACARTKVEKYTWGERAEKILNEIKSKQS